MCFWNADVLIQMEHLHARPVDSGQASEHFEKWKLRSASCGDDARLPVFLDGFSQDGSGLVRGDFCHLLFIFEAFDLHVVYDLAIRILLERVWCPAQLALPDSDKAAQTGTRLQSTAAVFVSLSEHELNWPLRHRSR